MKIEEELTAKAIYYLKEILEAGHINSTNIKFENYQDGSKSLSCTVDYASVTKEQGHE